MNKKQFCGMLLLNAHNNSNLRFDVYHKISLALNRNDLKVEKKT